MICTSDIKQYVLLLLLLSCSNSWFDRRTIHIIPFNENGEVQKHMHSHSHTWRKKKIRINIGQKGREKQPPPSPSPLSLWQIYFIWICTRTQNIHSLPTLSAWANGWIVHLVGWLFDCSYASITYSIHNIYSHTQNTPAMEYILNQDVWFKIDSDWILKNVSVCV